MNVSLICLSLKYVNKNYNLISNVSKWIYFELTRLNYKESKFVKSLDKKDFKIIEVLIKFNENTDSLSELLIKYCNECCNVIIELIIHNNISKDNDCLLKFRLFDVIKLFINHGANITICDNFILRFASTFGCLRVIKLLIENGADVHSKDNHSLKYSSSLGYFDIVKLLIENGADVHAENDYPLRFADINGYHDIVKLLIENGANRDLVIHTKLN